MTAFFWFLPTIVLALAVLSGRCSPPVASLLGLATAVPVAFATAPIPFGSAALAGALARGAWIGATIAPYILGGLLFWQLASRPTAMAAESARPVAVDRRAQRRLLFFACFLVGPFAESATGFGVGMLGTIALLRHLGIAPAHLMVFALLSQTFIPWGAMGSGTLLASAYAKMPASALAGASLLPVASLMGVWLTLFWVTARKAGVSATATEHLSEVGWIIASLGTLGVATALVGPEIAMLSAFGPLIIARYLIDARPTAEAVRLAAVRVWPYLALVGILTLTRGVPSLRDALASFGAIAPYPDLPVWAPLFHAGSWLMAGALGVALTRGHVAQLRQELRGAWKTARTPVVTVFVFAMLAEVLAAAGISAAIAAGLFANLGALGVLAAPLMSIGLGVLTNSGSAGNSLFMSSQVAMAAQANLSVPATAALQHVAASSMSLFSPVRMAIAASLAHGQGQERRVYSELVPYAIASTAILACLGAWAIL
jgi:lactate permease